MDDEIPDIPLAGSIAQWYGTHWDALVGLWTAEEGRSDMVLSGQVVETDDGAPGLKVVGNAYFGIKGKSPTGNSVNFGTHEETAGGTQQINASFRTYESYDEAAEDYAQVITTNKAFAGALPYRKEPQKFIPEIAKKYATDRKYTSSVLSIMKSHHLEQYDAQ